MQTISHPIGTHHISDLSRIAQDLQIRKLQVENVVQLLDDGNTVPFITRYRKERTGGLNEDVIRRIQDRIQQSRHLNDRKQTILKSIEGQGKLNDALRDAIVAADNTKRLEDLYLPFKPKKKSLANDAKERGLEPLAIAIWNRDPAVTNIADVLTGMLNPEKQLNSTDDVLAGVQHILAEQVAEMADVRGSVRHVIWDTGELVSTKADNVSDEQGKDFRDYFIFRESIRFIPPHRILAVNRGERENILKVKVEWHSERLHAAALSNLPLSDHPHKEFLNRVLDDALTRLLLPALEREVRRELTEHAQDSAVHIFARNLRSLLLQPPLRGKRILAIDPGLRTGCKLAALDQNGALLEEAVIYPHAPQNKKADAKSKLEQMLRRHHLSIMAIGNGTACRETEQLVSELIADLESGKTCIIPDPPEPTAPPAPIVPTAQPPISLMPVPAKENSVSPAAAPDVPVTAAQNFAANPESGPTAVENAPPVQEIVPLPTLVTATPTPPSDSHAVAEIVPLPHVVSSEVVRSVEPHSVTPMAASTVESPLVPIQSVGSVAQMEAKGDAPPSTAPSIKPEAASATAADLPVPAARLKEDVILPDLEKDIAYVIVNEAGASDYSASPIAREEFPTLDATTRGTVSIGRRLQDPLAELVKIDPQHVGVGLYQHDVRPKHLKESLEAVIESCVNEVGVEVNTASIPLLRHVSGLNQMVARDLVEFRSKHGPFRNRDKLKEIPGIGDARFTQAAGFLKIPDAEEPLDSTWIHPESYNIARQLLSELGFVAADLRDKEKLEELRSKFAAINPAEFAARTNTSEGGVRDLMDALAKPGRDPREDRPPPIFKKGILKLEDLNPGMELKGTVLNVVPFGAFVDIGLKDTGLVHISQMANRYIKNPYEVVAVGDVVTVWVLKVEGDRKRASLTMIAPGSERKPPERRPPAEQRMRQPRTDRPQSARPTPAPGVEPSQPNAPSRPPQRGNPPPRRDPQRAPQGGPPRAPSPGRENRPQAQPPSPSPPPPPRKPSRPKQLPKLSQEALKGKTPLHSFGELEAFFKAKDAPEPIIEAVKPVKDAESSSPEAPKEASVPESQPTPTIETGKEG